MMVSTSECTKIMLLIIEQISSKKNEHLVMTISRTCTYFPAYIFLKNFPSIRTISCVIHVHVLDSRLVPPLSLPLSPLLKKVMLFIQ